MSLAVAGGLAFCTAITGNFASPARVLARSLRAHHPDVPLVALVAERSASLGDWDEPDFVSLPIEDLTEPDLPRQAFLNPPHELTVLAKPLVMRHLLERGCHTVVFLDSDILVLDDLSPALAASAAHAITLMPHLLSAPERDAIARELAIDRSGTFNGGFVAVSARPEARRFLDWWIGRLRTHNRLEPGAGLHHDQRWLDLVPGFFDDVAIVRDPGCNVAHWNLPERRLHTDGARLLVDGGPCRFFHFSGFDPRQPGVLSKHATHLALAESGAVRTLIDRYVAALQEAGFGLTGGRPYSFGTFDNGVPIPLLARRLYRDAGDLAMAVGDPFRTGAPGCLYDWLRAPDDRPGPGAGLPRLWAAVVRSRGDLQQAFPDPAGADRARFAEWVRDWGLREHTIDAAWAL